MGRGPVGDLATAIHRQEKGILALSWVSQLLAVAGGVGIASTFLGNWISATVGLFPDWLGPLLLFAAVIAWAIDLIVDGIPNRMAIWCALLVPSLARSVHGELGVKVTSIAGQLANAINSKLGSLLGTTSILSIALAAALAALLVARRVIAKGGR
jgi:hypothetical protein